MVKARSPHSPKSLNNCPSQTKRLCVRGSLSDNNEIDDKYDTNQGQSSATTIQPNNTAISTENTMTANGSISLDSDNRDFIGQLYDNLASSHEKCLEALESLKIFTIAYSKKKDLVTERGFIPRLLIILQNSEYDTQIKTQIALIFNSLAKETEIPLKTLLENNVPAHIINTMMTYQNDINLTDACLRCLRSLFIYDFIDTQLLLGHIDENGDNTTVGSNTQQLDRYKLLQFTPSSVLQYMINLASSTRSGDIQECVATILAHSCQTYEHQTILCNSLAIDCIVKLLQTPYYTVNVAALKWLANLCYKNEAISTLVAQTKTDSDESILDILIKKMDRDNTDEIQFLSAKCYTFINRAAIAIMQNDKRIIFWVLHTLVRMVKKDKHPQLRSDAADCISYLIEPDVYMQQTASICDNLISSLFDMLSCKPDNLDLTQFRPLSAPLKSLSWNEAIPPRPVFDLRSSLGLASSSNCSIMRVEVCNKNFRLCQEMKQASFKAFAALSANDEDIRRRIMSVENYNIMTYVVEGLSDGGNVKTVSEALCCLHSLSRSVQQLRTSFNESNVWTSLKYLLNKTSDEVLILVSSTLCNLLLEFSPGKQHFLDQKAIESLCNLTRRQNEPALRLNGVWALMNMAFQADQETKSQILTSLSIDQIFRLLQERDVEILLKTLGLLRNLLSEKAHIETIMATYGKQIMQAVIGVLSGDHPVEVQEQALCILANIADGDTAKELFIMSNDEILRKLSSYLVGNHVKLQLAAIFCISNLVWRADEGSKKRQEVLRRIGVHGLLHKLINNSDSSISNRARTALDQFI